MRRVVIERFPDGSEAIVDDSITRYDTLTDFSKVNGIWLIPGGNGRVRSHRSSDVRLKSWIGIAISACACLSWQAGTLAAATVHGSPDSGSGTVTVEARTSPIVRIGSGGGGSSTPRCAWEPMFFTRDIATDPFTGGEVLFGFDPSFPPAIREIGGAESRLYRVSCPGGPTDQRWVRIGTSSADLIPSVVDIVEAQLQLPVLDINPSPADGGFVNLGMWLAVEPQTIQPVTAEAGTAWITVRPRLSSTEFDLGNGDTVACTGTGVAIEAVHPSLDVVEQSPTCGYTYRTSSAEDAPYRMTVTTVWELPYTSSQGSGGLRALRRSITVGYDVDEIQTVGIAN
jgi:hypothetical protein